MKQTTPPKTFPEYWATLSPIAKKKLISNSCISFSYLSQIANGHRNAGVATIKKLMGADSKISFSMFE